VPLHPILAGRWSARGYDATAAISGEHLRNILDAGRWAPTGGGNQPVRFVVGVRGDNTFDGLVEGLKRGNQSWAPAAAALIMLCTANVPDEPKMQDYAAMDVGFAASQMITQAQADGWNAHPMGGFRAEAMTERFSIPSDRRPLIVLAVGKLADPASLTPEIAERDSRERTRLPLHDVAFSDSWGSSYTSER
jgi:nitroreductase